MAAVLHGLARRLQLPTLMNGHDSVLVLGILATVNGLISIAIMAAAALVTGSPFIFPSLGPTAFLLFYTPSAPAASPRNTVLGHLVGAVAGYLALVLFGLTQAEPALTSAVTAPRVGAAALSLALTSGVMVWARVPHPPAGATTLIISLGILREPWQLAALMAAVVLLTFQGFVINRPGRHRLPEAGGPAGSFPLTDGRVPAQKGSDDDAAPSGLAAPGSRGRGRPSRATTSCRPARTTPGR